MEILGLLLLAWGCVWGLAQYEKVQQYKRREKEKQAQEEWERESAPYWHDLKHGDPKQQQAAREWFWKHGVDADAQIMRGWVD